MLILGHRGYSARYPPNTLKAFLMAIKYGADGVELDVWRTADGKIIISHDGNLKDTAGVDVDVKKSTYNELKKYDVQGEPLPLLEEVYEALPEDAIINVEIKDIDAVKGALDIVKRYDAMDRTLFSSFNMNALRRLREESKDAWIGILMSDLNKLLTAPRWIYSLRAQYLNLPHLLARMPGKKLSRALIRFYRLFGVRIAIWTPNTLEELNPFKGLCEMVITDEVELMVKHRNAAIKGGAGFVQA